MFDYDESESKICKNCERFRKASWWNGGKCELEFPPFVLLDPDNEVRYHDTCSFFKGKN